MRVLALDPGERVGWAVGTIETPDVGDQPLLRVRDHGISYLKDAASTCYKTIVVDHLYDAVVYETFRLTAKGARVLVGSDLQTAQFVGMLRLCCWLANVPAIGQPPAAMSSARRSAAKHPLGEDLMSRVAKADAGSHDDGHDGSALLHLWTYWFDRYA